MDASERRIRRRMRRLERKAKRHVGEFFADTLADTLGCYRRCAPGLYVNTTPEELERSAGWAREASKGGDAWPHDQPVDRRGRRLEARVAHFFERAAVELRALLAALAPASTLVCACDPDEAGGLEDDEPESVPEHVLVASGGGCYP